MDDFLKHYVFLRIAKINKKIFIPNFLNELLALPIRLVILIVVWSSVYKVLGSDEIRGLSLGQMISYYFIFEAISHMSVYYRRLPYTIWNEITNGEVSKFICRPISYITYQFFYGFGYTYYSSIICIPMILLASFIYLIELGNLNSIIFFVISMLLGIVITFYIYILIGFLTFWTESIFGYRDLILHIGGILSGSVIPLLFMPEWLQNISMLLPFRYMVYEPITLLINNFTYQDMLGVLTRQTIYIILLSLATQMIWNKGVKRYEAQGG